MNCQELTQILDEQDLRQLPVAEREVAAVHLAGCPDCARVLDMHVRLAALPMPPLAPERIAGWRAVAVSGGLVSRRQRMRSRLIVIGALAAVAAAAAILAMRPTPVPEQSTAAALPAAQLPLPAVVQPAGEVITAAKPQPAVHEIEQPGTVAAQLPQAAFTVFVQPLQHETEDPAARALGEEYYAGLLKALVAIPGLALISSDQQQDAAAKPADFRIKVTSGYGRVPERFGGHEQWFQNLLAYAHGSGGAESYTQVLGFSINPDCGRLNPADVAMYRGCTPAGLVEIGIEQLRRRVFPAVPATMAQLQAQFLDTSLPQGMRRQALADLITLRQKTPGPMDPRLIDVIIHDAIANAPYPAQRISLWRALRGQANAVMIQPLLELSRLEADDTVRIEIVGLMAADFGTNQVVRGALQSIAKSDQKLLVRKVAERAVSADAWRKYVVDAVKDTSLPAALRFEPLAWMAEMRITRPSDTRMEADLAAITRQLFDGGHAAALADVLAQAANGTARPASEALQAWVSSVQHPAVADFLLAGLGDAPDFARISLLGRHRDDSRIEAKLKDLAANHPDAAMRQTIAEMLGKPR